MAITKGAAQLVAEYRGTNVAEVDDTMLVDSSFYTLINELSELGRNHLSEFINFDFDSAKKFKGATEDLQTRRIILKLCITCVAQQKK